MKFHFDFCFFFFFQAEDGIRDAQESRGLGDVYKRQPLTYPRTDHGHRLRSRITTRSSRIIHKRVDLNEILLAGRMRLSPYIGESVFEIDQIGISIHFVGGTLNLTRAIRHASIPTAHMSSINHPCMIVIERASSIRTIVHRVVVENHVATRPAIILSRSSGATVVRDSRPHIALRWIGIEEVPEGLHVDPT